VDFVAAENDYRQSREKRVEVLWKSGRADLRATAELAHAYNNLARLYRCKSQSGSSLSLYKVLSFNARGLALQFMTVRGRAAGASRVDYYTACTELGNTFSEIGDALLLAKYPAAAETAYRLAGNVFQAVNVDRPQADTILALANAQIGQLKSMLPRPNRNEKRIDDLVQNIDKHIKKLLGQGVDLAYLSKTKDAFADSLKLRSLPAPN